MLSGSLEEMLGKLAEQGCHPSVYYRGEGIWRAHVNVPGNLWEDATSPLAALEAASANWERLNKILDGMAAALR